ncbi:phosphotransferase family protein [Streptomyces sp. NRRL WC-3742]|uniref:phosphotransferase family protein n=1 Tax=Streptomyces sp. NRRL WC-3742 TaxID=1463934 RepID=UPI0004C51F15|nr:aminoglycoside phosphotransferase family protein [Streptomyces sp. NRRL WC-3742]
MIDDNGETAPEWGATRRWVEGLLAPGERIGTVRTLRGGWTSVMRRLDVESEVGEGRSLVLRSFVKPFYLRHAEGLLNREAEILRLLAPGPVPAARVYAVDATAEHCDHPSLVMSLLPGTVRLAEDGAGEGGSVEGGSARGGEVEHRIGLLARQLATVHAVTPPQDQRPRAWQAWTAPERVAVPGHTARPELWARAIAAIDREAPAHRPCFLHRDFHPGNVLFTGSGADTRISGVVDWVETSWGPADLDVAHCSTALALLHGVEAGMSLADRYREAGGLLSPEPGDHLYWRLLDALAFAPDAEKVAVPWRELGREDLTPAVLTGRLEDYLQALFDRFDRFGR